MTATAGGVTCALTAGGTANVNIKDGAYTSLTFTDDATAFVDTAVCDSLNAAGGAQVTVSGGASASTNLNGAVVTLKNGTYTALTAGGSSAVILENGAYPSLTVKDSASVTAENGVYTALTINGVCVTLEPEMRIKQHNGRKRRAWLLQKTVYRLRYLSEQETKRRYWTTALRTTTPERLG